MIWKLKPQTIGPEKDYIYILWLSTKDTIKIGMYADSPVGKQFLFISGSLVISVNNFGDTSWNEKRGRDCHKRIMSVIICDTYILYRLRKSWPNFRNDGFSLTTRDP